MTTREPEIEQVDIDYIDVPPGRRAIDVESVSRLALSMQTIGLRTPITVRYFPDRKSPSGSDDSIVLVAGAHRLAAARSLGWEKIACIYVDDDDIDAELWEIAENLHRAELTTLQRSDQIARWIELTEAKYKPAQVAPVSGGRGNTGGINAASRELGIERTDAQRAVKVASISDDAKQAARDAGLDDNRSALLAVAREKTAEAQTAKVNEIAKAKSATKQPEAPRSEPVTVSDADAEEAENIARALVIALSAMDPLIDRIIEIGEAEFWGRIRSRKTQLELSRQLGIGDRLCDVEEAGPWSITKEEMAEILAAEEAASSQPAAESKAVPTADDSHLDIPGFLRREPAPAAEAR